MSIASILGFLATAVIARPNRDDRVAELERENARLKEELDDAQETSNRWRNHALAVIARQTPIPLGGQHALMNPLALLQQAQAFGQNARMNAQQGLQQSGYLLGMQNLDAERFCNCVPSRAQVWAADRGE